MRNAALALVTAVALAACIPVYAPEVQWERAPSDQAALPAGSRAKLVAGDVVRVLYREDRHKDAFHIRQLEPRGFIGISLEDRRTRHVPYASLELMEVKRGGWGWSLLPLY